MEVENIYWREDALNNLQDILAANYRHGIKAVEKLVKDIIKDISFLKGHPFHGYRETSMMKAPKKILSYISTKQVKIIYYIENNNLYIIDFWDT